MTMISSKEFKNCFKTFQLLLLEEVTEVTMSVHKKEQCVFTVQRLIQHWIGRPHYTSGIGMGELE